MRLVYRTQILLAHILLLSGAVMYQWEVVLAAALLFGIAITQRVLFAPSGGRHRE